MFKTVTFEITGEERLACEGCGQRVERVLKALPGVRQARARVPDQTIEVLFDMAVLEPNAIAERLSKAGYQTRVGSSASDSGSGG